jgi:hypothetical protein
VSRFWKREDELEAWLRASRPEAGGQFVATLAARIEESRRPRAKRLALAGGLTATALAVFGAFGGLGYAAKSARTATHLIEASKPAATGHQNTSGSKAAGRSNATAASNQYAGKTTICHRTHSAKNPFVLITVSNNALPAHKAHGDTLPGPGGTCPGPPIP